MPNKKVYIVLFIILVVFFLVMFLLFGIDNIKQDNLQTTIVVGDNTTWTYQNRRWLYLRNNTSMQEFNWTLFHVYENNEDKGSYYLWHDDKWYLFDEKKNAVPVNGNLLAYQANYKMNILKFEEKNVDDLSFVQNVLREHNLSTSSQFSSIYKVDIDFDGDSILEEFYIISNAFALDFNPDVTFSIAFMVKNDTIYYLYQDVSSNAGYNACKPFYNSFIDTNQDGVYEVILSCGKYSASEQVDMLYQFMDNEFKLLISNQ